MTFKKGMNKVSGSGRQKGVPNRKNAELRAMVEQETRGVPLPVLMTRWAVQAHREAENSSEIAGAAKTLGEAAKFVYPHLKAVELSGEVKQAPQLVISLVETQGQNTEGTNNDKA